MASPNALLLCHTPMLLGLPDVTTHAHLWAAATALLFSGDCSARQMCPLLKVTIVLLKDQASLKMTNNIYSMKSKVSFHTWCYRWWTPTNLHSSPGLQKVSCAGGCHCPAPDRRCQVTPCVSVSRPAEVLQASQFKPRGTRNFSTFSALPRGINSSHVCLSLQEASSTSYKYRVQCFADHRFSPHHSAITAVFSMMAFCKNRTRHISTTNGRLEQFPPYTQAIRR